MKASELIAQLQAIVAERGDVEAIAQLDYTDDFEIVSCYFETRFPTETMKIIFQVLPMPSDPTTGDGS